MSMTQEDIQRKVDEWKAASYKLQSDSPFAFQSENPAPNLAAGGPVQIDPAMAAQNKPSVIRPPTPIVPPATPSPPRPAPDDDLMSRYRAIKPPAGIDMAAWNRAEMQRELAAASTSGAALVNSQAVLAAQEKERADLERQQAIHEEADKKARAHVDEVNSTLKQVQDEVMSTAAPTAKNPYGDWGGAKGLALVLLSGIAGGAAGALHQPNKSLDIINDNISRDYQQQKDAWGRKLDKLADAKGQSAEARAALKDEDFRWQSYYQTRIMQTQHEIAGAHDLFASQASKDAALAQMGTLSQQSQAQLAQFGQQAYARKRDALLTELSLMPHLTQEQIKQRDELASAQIPGRVYIGQGVPKPEQTKAVREKDEQAAKVQRLVQDAIDFRNANGATLVNRHVVQEGIRKRDALRLALAQYHGYKRLTPQVVSMVGVPDDLTTFSIGGDKVLNALRGIQQSVQAGADETAKANGYQPALQEQAGNR